MVVPAFYLYNLRRYRQYGLMVKDKPRRLYSDDSFNTLAKSSSDPEGDGYQEASLRWVEGELFDPR